MNIAMMTNSYAPLVGGVPISVQRLAGGLREAGHSVTIFAPGEGGPGEAADDGQDVVRCRVAGSAGAFRVPSLFCSAPYREFRRRRYDLIHVHHPMLMGNTAWALSRLHDLPLVFTWHTLYWHYLHYLPGIGKLEPGGKGLRGKAAGRLHKYLSEKFIPRYIYWFARQCDRVFLPSPGIRDEVARKLEAGRVRLLPTGVPEHFFTVPEAARRAVRQKWADGRLLFCTVSRLGREKNIAFLLEAASAFKSLYGSSFTFLVIGDGPERQTLEQRAAELALGDCVKFLGPRANSELAAYYAASDLFLFASKTETQGIVLLEAMAAGTPVVAVRASGVNDVVSDGKNGRLTADSVEDFVAAMCGLCADPAGRQAAAMSARELARRFSTAGIAARAETAYREAVALKEAGKKHDLKAMYAVSETARSNKPH